MKTIQILFIALLVSFGTSAQQKLVKISQSFNVDDDVTIDLNTSYTNIIIDTWNKDIVEVEAFIESDELSKEELQNAFEAWDVNVEHSNSSILIESGGQLNTWSNGISLFGDESLEALKHLEIELADLPEMPEMKFIMESLDIPNMPKIPNLPDLPDGMNNFNFDYEKYQEEGEAYLEKWSKEYEDKYGKEYSQKMEVWAKKFDEKDWKEFEQKMEEWGEKFGEEFGAKFEKDMEEWGESFGKKMEAWGEDFEKRIEESDFEEKMEAWGEELGKRIEAQLEGREDLEHEGEGLFNTSSKSNLKVKKTIKIKMPKKAILKVNVRHGELKFASAINNVNAILSHSTLIANSIDGSQTSINASYSPVMVSNWNLGELSLNYVENAKIENANHLVLNSNSSNVSIKNLSGNAVIDGSFGDLIIHNIKDSFNNLNVVLENSDARITLPKSDFNFQYKGNHSYLNHPDNKDKENVTSFSTGNINSNKSIVINAKFSEVVMQ